MSTSHAQNAVGGLSPLVQISVVFGGYVLALVAAWAMADIYDALSPPDPQVSSGMQAGAELIIFLAAFGFAAVIPTGAALWLLRPYPRFWSVMSISSLAFAATGLIGLSLYILGPPSSSPLAIWAALFVLRVFVAPGFAVAMIVAALLSPSRWPRIVFLSAATAECGICVYVFFNWFIAQ